MIGLPEYAETSIKVCSLPILHCTIRCRCLKMYTLRIQSILPAPKLSSLNQIVDSHKRVFVYRSKIKLTATLNVHFDLYGIRLNSIINTQVTIT